ncbi:MAG TPA: hypothetical protein VFM14_09245 [Gemmatimonadales bacterium]|nr:hypothetical protein [Gemmatimonadales bacterium]
MIGLVIGLALWMVPALAFAEPEPWDDDGPAYPLALLASGLVLGFLAPGQRSAAVAGVFGGQFLALLGRVVARPATSELWLVGAMILAVFTLVLTGAGTLVGGALRAWLGPKRP